MSEKDLKEEQEESRDDTQDQPDEALAVTEVQKLREELEAKQLEAKENYDRYLRQVAELENFKKRVAREKEESLKYGSEVLVRDLFPVLDNLERAVEHARGGGNGKPFIEGVEMTLKSFLEVFQKHGVTQISAKGEPFDPQKHEAFAHVETDQHDPNTVVEEIHKGYFLLDRLLRPSLVSVAKPVESKAESSEGEAKEGKVENGEHDG